MAEEPRTGPPSADAEQAYARYLLGTRRGSEDTFDDFCRSHPELADELRTLHSRFTAGSQRPPPSSASSSSTLRRILEQGPTSTRYRNDGEIARGGMGAILRVWDDDLRRTLAMKVVLGKGEKEDQVSETKLVRFLEEAQITGQLDHPGVVPVHEIGLDPSGRVYFTMQLVKGRDLKQIFELVRERREGWSITRALGVVLRVCEAMAFAHEKGVIHRDLKPANVMVGRFGETYVMDWGLAKVLGRDDSHDLRLARQDAATLSLVHTDRGDSDRSSDSPLFTMDGDVVGTPCYMPPEQAKGQLEDMGPRSDVYSVGAMLYELLTGSAPYVQPGESASPQAVLALVLHGPPKTIEEIDRGVPSELVAICEKAMARDSRERYESMLLMAEDLRAFLENRVVRAYEAGAVAEFRKWIGRNRALATSLAAAGLAVVLGLAGVAWVQSRYNRELLAANAQIADARDEVLDAQGELIAANAELERTNEDLAAASEHARQQEREALLRGYSANLAAADASLRSHQVDEAARRLDLCDTNLRGWEWRRLRIETDSSLWYGQVESTQSAFFAVADAVFSPDGSRIAAATATSAVQLLSTENGEVLRTFGDVPATSLAWTPDGARIVAGSGDRRVRIFDANSGELLREFRAHRSHVQDVAVSPDGNRIATSSGDKTVKAWTLEGELLRTFEGHTSRVTCVAWDPSGERIASGSRDRTVRVWNATTGEVELVLTGHAVSLGDVAFGPRGVLLASASLDLHTGRVMDGGSRDNTIRVWDARTGGTVAELRGHTDGIPAIDFAPDGRLVSSSLDRTVRVWNVDSGEATVLLGHGSRATCASFSPEGDLVVSGSQDLTVRLWDPEAATGLTFEGHPREVVGVVPLGEERLLSVSREGSIRLWDTRSGEALHVLRGHDLFAEAIAYAPDNGRLVTAGTVGAGGLGLGSSTNRAYLWDVGTRTRLTHLEGQDMPIRCLAITPDGSRVVGGSQDKLVGVWDGRTGERSAVLEGHENAVAAVAIHPDGELVLSSSREATYSWDLATGEPTRVLEELKGELHRVRFTETGDRLVAAVPGSLVKVWSTEGFVEQLALTGHGGAVTDAVFSPDQTRIATCSVDGSVRLWDAATGEGLLALRSPRGTVRVLAFSTDGASLIGGYTDGRVHVWSTEDPAERSTARRTARALRERAHTRVAALFEQWTELDRVIAGLRADPSLDEDVRGAAIRLAESTRESPIQTEDEVWLAVRPRFAPRSTYEKGLWKARLAAAEHPDDEKPLRLVGMALYRLGRYEEALEVLERAHALRIDHRRARPEVAAFLAMTHHRLGNEEHSQRYLELVRGLMGVSTLQANSDSMAFLEEAEALTGYN